MLNSRFNVYRSEWLELVFANRNQSYGAFELRKNYEKTLSKALFLATVLFVGAVSAPLVYSKFIKQDVENGQSVKPNDEVIVVLSQAVQQKKPLVLPQEKPAAAKVVAEKISNSPSIRYTEPRVVPAADATEDIPTIEDLQAATISTITQGGTGSGDNLMAGEGIGSGKGEGSGAGVSDEPVTLGTVERYPEFPGGMDAFAKFLRKHLRYPGSAVENGIQGRVTLSFVVERDGSLTDIRILRGIGFGCDEEAVRVLKKSPLWSAGIQNERKVRVQYSMPIVFQMD